MKSALIEVNILLERRGEERIGEERRYRLIDKE